MCRAPKGHFWRFLSNQFLFISWFWCKTILFIRSPSVRRIAFFANGSSLLWHTCWKDFPNQIRHQRMRFGELLVKQKYCWVVPGCQRDIHVHLKLKSLYVIWASWCKTRLLLNTVKPWNRLYRSQEVYFHYQKLLRENSEIDRFKQTNRKKQVGHRGERDEPRIQLMTLRQLSLSTRSKSAVPNLCVNKKNKRMLTDSPKSKSLDSTISSCSVSSNVKSFFVGLLSLLLSMTCSLIADTVLSKDIRVFALTTGVESLLNASLTAFKRFFIIFS